MKINARIALVSFFSIVALGAFGCSAGEEPAPLQLPPANGSRTPSAGTGTQAPASGEQTPPGAPAAGETAQPGADGAGDPAGGKQASDPSGKQPTQPDAQCVASCNSGLKAKCQGDDTFCADVCVSLTATELSCLSSAPTCDKPEWIRCMPEENSGGGK